MTVSYILTSGVSVTGQLFSTRVNSEDFSIYITFFQQDFNKNQKNKI